jgi:hypothetical protein
MSARAVIWRRRIARTFLGIAALVQLLLILALPFDAYRSAERGSLFVLAALLVATVGSAIALRSQVRRARWILSIASVYGFVIVVNLTPWTHAMNVLRGVSERPSVVWSAAIVTFMFGCELVGAVLAWTLPSVESSKVRSLDLAN